LLQQFVGSPPLLLRRPPEQSWNQGDVLPHGPVRKQAKFLNHIPDPPSQLDRINITDVLAVYHNAPTGGLEQAIY
jgi:hypothetical protein